MFAGSCIGVILLVMSLEFLRRLGKEYDRYILRQHQRAATTVYNSQAGAAKTDSDNGVNEHRALTPGSTAPASFRSNAIQQAVHATLHMVQFAVAYFVMLLAMYYNGYFIIALLLGRGWALLSLAGKVLVMRKFTFQGLKVMS
jgi:copper transporter 1